MTRSFHEIESPFEPGRFTGTLRLCLARRERHRPEKVFTTTRRHAEGTPMTTSTSPSSPRQRNGPGEAPCAVAAGHASVQKRSSHNIGNSPVAPTRRPPPSAPDQRAATDSEGEEDLRHCAVRRCQGPGVGNRVPGGGNGGLRRRHGHPRRSTVYSPRWSATGPV
jgi:hypothetical protein